MPLDSKLKIALRIASLCPWTFLSLWKREDQWKTGLRSDHADMDAHWMSGSRVPRNFQQDDLVCLGAKWGVSLPSDSSGTRVRRRPTKPIIWKKNESSTCLSHGDVTFALRAAGHCKSLDRNRNSNVFTPASGFVRGQNYRRASQSQFSYFSRACTV